MYKAHKNDITGKVQTVKEHSENTAFLCEKFSIPELKDVMYMIGLMHDIGKYQASFQQKIDGKNIKVEHSICGAIEAKDIYEPTLNEHEFLGCSVIKNLEEFKEKSSIIMANRLNEDLTDVKDKIYTRDLFATD